MLSFHILFRDDKDTPSTRPLAEQSLGNIGYILLSVLMVFLEFSSLSIKPWFLTSNVNSSMIGLKEFFVKSRFYCLRRDEKMSIEALVVFCSAFRTPLFQCYCFEALEAEEFDFLATSAQCVHSSKDGTSLNSSKLLWHDDDSSSSSQPFFQRC